MLLSASPAQVVSEKDNLREKIVAAAIFSSIGNSISTAKKLKLVSRDWLRTVNDLQNKPHTFHNLLRKSGNTLVRITLNIERLTNAWTVKPVPNNTPPLSLVRLQRCKIEYMPDVTQVEKERDIFEYLQYFFNGHFQKPFQLEYATIPNLSDRRGNSTIPEFSAIRFPKEVTRFTLDYMLPDDNHLEALLTTNTDRLRNLEVISITHTHSPTVELSPEVLTHFLRPNANKLFSLSLISYDRELRFTAPPPLELPVMVGLDYLELSEGCVFGNASRGGESKTVRLKELQIDVQSSEDLRIGLEQFSSEELETLEVIINGSATGRTVSLSRRDMERVNVAFPNVTDLNMGMGLPNNRVEGIQCVFREMTQLRRLQICWQFEMMVDWDALLIGYPPEKMRELRDEYKAKKTFSKFQENKAIPSLRDLENLETFGLMAVVNSPKGLLEKYKLSDLSFHLAFLRMGTLQKLDIGNGNLGFPRAFRNFSEDVCNSWNEAKAHPLFEDSSTDDDDDDDEYSGIYFYQGRPLPNLPETAEPALNTKVQNTSTGNPLKASSPMSGATNAPKKFKFNKKPANPTPAVTKKVANVKSPNQPSTSTNGQSPARATNQGRQPQQSTQPTNAGNPQTNKGKPVDNRRAWR